MNRPIRLATLRALKACGRFLLPEKALYSAARLEVEPEPTLSEAQTEWRAMEIDGLIVPARNPLGEVVWKLTAAGDATATELKL